MVPTAISGSGHVISSTMCATDSLKCLRREEPTFVLLFFLGTVPAIDLAGTELIGEIRETLAERGIEFRLAEAHSGAREALRRAGFEKNYGPIQPDQTVATVLQRWENSPATTSI